MTFGFMGLILYTVYLPILPNAKELMPVAHDISIPDTSGLSGFSLIIVLLFGAVRGFALLTGDVNGANPTLEIRRPSAEISEEDRAHWAFQPVKDRPLPDVADASWCRSEPRSRPAWRR